MNKLWRFWEVWNKMHLRQLSVFNFCHCENDGFKFFIAYFMLCFKSSNDQSVTKHQGWLLYVCWAVLYFRLPIKFESMHRQNTPFLAIPCVWQHPNSHHLMKFDCCICFVMLHVSMILVMECLRYSWWIKTVGRDITPVSHMVASNILMNKKHKKWQQLFFLPCAQIGSSLLMFAIEILRWHCWVQTKDRYINRSVVDGLLTNIGGKT